MGKGVIGKEEVKGIGSECGIESECEVEGIESVIGSAKCVVVVSRTSVLGVVRGEEGATTEGYDGKEE